MRSWQPWSLAETAPQTGPRPREATGSRTAATAVVAAATIVVELTTLTTLTAILSLLAVALVVVVRASTMVALSTNLLHSTVLATLVGKDGTHEVLLHFLEAALLALLVQLLSGHPELDGKGSSTERRRLVEKLNCTLGAVDILIEDEVLTVGCRRIKVFTLTEL